MMCFFRFSAFSNSFTHFYNGLISLFCILDQVVVDADFSRLNKEDDCGAAEFEAAFFLPFFTSPDFYGGW